MGDKNLLTVYRYRSLGEVAPRIRELYDSRQEAVFVVPGAADRPHFEALVGPDEYFGHRTARFLHWDEIPRWIVRETGANPPWPFLDPIRRWLVLCALLKQELSRYPGQHPEAVTKSAFLPLLEQALRYSLREGSTPGSIQQALECGGCTPEGLCRIPGSISGWVCLLRRRYLVFLAESGWHDSAQSSFLARQYLAGADSSLVPRSLVLVGFMRFTWSQQRLLHGFLERGFSLTWFHPESGTDDPLWPSGAVEIPSEKEPVAPLPVFTLSGGDRRMELTMVIRELVLWSRGEGRLSGQETFPGWEKIGMTVPLDALPVVLEVLKRYRIPHAITQGRPVREGRLGDLIERFMRVVGGGWSSRETAFFLADSLIGGEKFPLTHALTVAPRGEAGWRKFLQDEGLVGPGFDCWFELGKLVEGNVRAETLLEQLESVLVNDGDLTGHSSNLAENDHTLDWTVGEITRTLGELRRTLLSLQDPAFPLPGEVLTREDAANFLVQWLERSTLPPLPVQGKGLALYPGDPPSLAQHQVMVVCAVEADRFPGGSVHSPFEGEGVGVFSPTGSRQQAHARFLRLVAAGERLTILSRCLQDDSGRPVSPSPFPAELFDGEKRWAVLNGELERPLSQVLYGGEPHFPEVEVSGEWQYQPRSFSEPSSSRITEGRMSDLDTWLECPFRVACFRILGLRPAPRPGVDRSLLGEVVHRLWAAVPRELAAGGDTLAEWLRHEFAVMVTEKYPVFAGERFRRRRRSLEKTLEVLAGEMEHIHRTYDIQPDNDHREFKLPTLFMEGVNVHGRCDRLVILPGHRFLLFDYKLGHSQNTRGSKQLAAYALALSATHGLHPAGLFYVCHQDATVVRCVEEGRGKKPGDMMEEAREGLNQMAGGIREDRWPANPQSTLCPGCFCTGLCRREEGMIGGEGSDE